MSKASGFTSVTCLLLCLSGLAALAAAAGTAVVVAGGKAPVADAVVEQRTSIAHSSDGMTWSERILVAEAAGTHLPHGVGEPHPGDPGRNKARTNPRSARQETPARISAPGGGSPTRRPRPSLAEGCVRGFRIRTVTYRISSGPNSVGNSEVCMMVGRFFCHVVCSIAVASQNSIYAVFSGEH